MAVSIAERWAFCTQTSNYESPFLPEVQKKIDHNPNFKSHYRTSSHYCKFIFHSVILYSPNCAFISPKCDLICCIPLNYDLGSSKCNFISPNCNFYNRCNFTSCSCNFIFDNLNYIYQLQKCFYFSVAIYICQLWLYILHYYNFASQLLLCLLIATLNSISELWLYILQLQLCIL